MRLRHSIWILALAVANAATAQTTFPQPPADAPVHDELRALQIAMEGALNQRDLDALLVNVDDDVVFTTMNGDVARGKQAIRQYFTRMMTGPDKIVESVRSDFVPDALAVFHGPDVAVAVGKTDDHYELTDGKSFDIHARWTATLVRKEGRWLVGAFHYSTNVFDNPILTTQRNYLIAGGIAVALLLGLIAYFVGRWTGRRRAG